MGGYRRIARNTLHAVCAAVLLAACSMGDQTEAANWGVVHFHEMLDGQQFDAIYDQSSEDLKKVATKADMVALLAAVHRKLGNMKSTARQTWNINYNTGGTFVSAFYKTTFAEGEAQEQFVFRVEGKTAQLAGYHISSNALILK